MSETEKKPCPEIRIRRMGMKDLDAVSLGLDLSACMCLRYRSDKTVQTLVTFNAYLALTGDIPLQYLDQCGCLLRTGQDCKEKQEYY